MAAFLLCWLFGWHSFSGGCYCNRCGMRDRSLGESYDWNNYWKEPSEWDGYGVYPEDFGDQ